MNLFKELKSGSAGKIQVGQSLHTMSTALKDNTTLRFAVITGCLKIAKKVSSQERIILCLIILRIPDSMNILDLHRKK